MQVLGKLLLGSSEKVCGKDLAFCTSTYTGDGAMQWEAGDLKFTTSTFGGLV